MDVRRFLTACHSEDPPTDQSLWRNKEKKIHCKSNHCFFLFVSLFYSQTSILYTHLWFSITKNWLITLRQVYNDNYCPDETSCPPDSFLPSSDPAGSSPLVWCIMIWCGWKGWFIWWWLSWFKWFKFIGLKSEGWGDCWWWPWLKYCE